MTAKRDGAEFRLASIPSSFNVASTQAFDPAYMKALFRTGFELGRRGTAWRRGPPELSATAPARPSTPVAAK
jgi:hypothetical protein